MADLPIWECRNRIRVLEEFNRQLAIYSSHSVPRHRTLGQPTPVDETRAKSRETINRMTPKVSRYLAESNNYPLINVKLPPAAGGGGIPNIDAMANIFDLSNLGIPLSTVSDAVQKAIGYYEDDLARSFFRTINPLWWLWKLAVAIIRIPFKIIGWAGYDSMKAEESKGGQIYKAVAGVAAFIAAVVGFLASLAQILDSQSVMVFVDRVFHR